MNTGSPSPKTPETMSRRAVIGRLFALAGAAALSGCRADREALKAFMQKHFKELTKEELAETLAFWEAKYSKQYDRPVSVSATPPLENVMFGYALDISRCVGCRRCVYACVEENNLSRDPQVHWITVLEMDKAKGIDLLHADAYYEAEEVPRPGKFYLPVACQHCENPPCVKACPVKATWKDPDGPVVIDYAWCIGCRCCVTACPYGARHFNWGRSRIPKDEVNPDTEYLGNRPRERGVVEKCSFCIQRVRKGRYPACVEICPVGARKFGNMLDAESEVRFVLENRRVYILKEELGTRPQFFYYFGL